MLCWEGENDGGTKAELARLMTRYACLKGYSRDWGNKRFWRLPMSPKTSEVYIHTSARGRTLPITADFLTLRLSKTSEVW